MTLHNKCRRNLFIAGIVAASLAGISASAIAADQSGASGAGESATTASAARGAQEWQGNCGRCHNYRSPSEYSDRNWQVIVNHMRTIAPLPGQVARDIAAFLKASNG